MSQEETLGQIKSLCRKDWRKLVKKLRRKRIRQKAAIQRVEEEKKIDLSAENLTQLAKDRLLEEYELEKEEREKEKRHQQWLRDDEELCQIWRAKQSENMKKEEAKQAAQRRIKEEWESAKKRKAEKEREIAEAKRLAELQIDLYIKQGGEPPKELRVLHETNPLKEPCPFFSKVAACRFGSACSRNHVMPGISKVILIPGFYSHFTLYQNRSAEYDTDVGLEFEESETYRDFREFFEDVVTELRTWNGLRVVQVCRNSEPHLRGNLYAEYDSERPALAAYRGLHARWYGGRQITVHFATISDWSSAVCGDFKRGRCPKGAECNFLHVFRNPRGELQPMSKREVSVSRNRSCRNWRWSESPERERTSRRSENTRSPTTRRSRESENTSRSPTRRRSRESDNTRSPTRRHSRESENTRSPTRRRSRESDNTRSPTRRRSRESYRTESRERSRERRENRRRRSRDRSPSSPRRRKQRSSSSRNQSRSPLSHQNREAVKK